MMAGKSTVPLLIAMFVIFIKGLVCFDTVTFTKCYRSKMQGTCGFPDLNLLDYQLNIMISKSVNLVITSPAFFPKPVETPSGTWTVNVTNVPTAVLNVKFQVDCYTGLFATCYLKVYRNIAVTKKTTASLSVTGKHTATQLQNFKTPMSSGSKETVTAILVNFSTFYDKISTTPQTPTILSTILISHSITNETSTTRASTLKGSRSADVSSVMSTGTLLQSPTTLSPMPSRSKETVTAILVNVSTFYDKISTTPQTPTILSTILISRSITNETSTTRTSTLKGSRSADVSSVTSTGTLPRSPTTLSPMPSRSKETVTAILVKCSTFYNKTSTTSQTPTILSTILISHSITNKTSTTRASTLKGSRSANVSSVTSTGTLLQSPSTLSTLSSPAFTPTLRADINTSYICICVKKKKEKYSANISSNEIWASVKDIKAELKIKKARLSSTIRKLTSASDNRTSSHTIGGFSVGILGGILTFIVILDIMNIKNHTQQCKCRN